MIRNYKALGVAFAAMLALSAFAAQGASAISGLTTEPAGISPVFVTGDQEGHTTFTATAHGGSVSCTEVGYKGQGNSVSGRVSELTVTPTYNTNTKAGANNCTAFGFPTHVTNHDCSFTFTTPTGGSATVPTWNPNDIHLLCSTGKGITITPTFGGISVCSQTIAAQTATGGHVVGTNITDSVSGKMAVTLDLTVTGIHYVGTGGVCGTAGVTTTDGDLTGSSTVRCYSDAAHATQIGCTFS